MCEVSHTGSMGPLKQHSGDLKADVEGDRAHQRGYTNTGVQFGFILI